MNVILDYFFVIGPSSDGDGHHPKVLAHLPKSVPWNKLNKATLANLASMCLPRGSRSKPPGYRDQYIESSIGTYNSVPI